MKAVIQHSVIELKSMTYMVLYKFHIFKKKKDRNIVGTHKQSFVTTVLIYVTINKYKSSHFTSIILL